MFRGPLIQTLWTEGVESMRTPSRSNKSALHRIAGDRPRRKIHGGVDSRNSFVVSFRYCTIAFYLLLFFPMSIPTHLPFPSQAEWLGYLSAIQPVAREMLERSDEDQRRLGYFHTFREIGQQPEPGWFTVGFQFSPTLPSCAIWWMGFRACRCRDRAARSMSATACVRRFTRVRDQRGGRASWSFAHRRQICVAGRKPSLMVSLARSGDSPESVGALALVRHLEPDVRHLVLTCNRQGRCWPRLGGDPGAGHHPGRRHE